MLSRGSQFTETESGEWLGKRGKETIIVQSFGFEAEGDHRMGAGNRCTLWLSLLPLNYVHLKVDKIYIWGYIFFSHIFFLILERWKDLP